MFFKFIFHFAQPQVNSHFITNCFQPFPTAADISDRVKPGTHIILAVNWTMLFLVDDRERILAEFSYPELTNINCNRDDDGQVTSFWLSTITNEEYSLSSPESEDIRDLVTQFLDGLKRRSKYAVAMQHNPNKVTEGSAFLKFEKGDLIVLEKPWGELQKQGAAWAFGTNGSTKKTGDFPMDCVYCAVEMKMCRKKLKNEKNEYFEKKNRTSCSSVFHAPI